MPFRSLARRWRARLAAWRDRDQESVALREEMDLHRDLRARKLRLRGLGDVDAMFAARRQFGNATSYQDQISDLWGWTMWERLIQDLRQGARSLGKARGFTAVAILTLALGLGINTAIFSVVNTVMLKPLPYPEPDRLVAMWEENTKRSDAAQSFSSRGAQVGSAGGATRTTIAVANVADYVGTGVFESLATYDLTAFNLTGIGTPERISGEAVTWNFFSALGKLPARGRSFLAEEDTPGAPLVAIVTNSFWTHRLGGSENAIGASIQLNSKPYRVVGILPAGFTSPAQIGLRTPIEVYVPASYPADLLTSRGDHEVSGVARLKPETSVESARAALATVSANLGKQFAVTNGHIRAAVAPLRDDLSGGVKQSLLALLGASGLIVLIACVNVANLLMVRAAGRRHESSVRMALGAGRLRMMRQLMTESLLLAMGGCVAGIGLGLLLIRALTAIAPAAMPRIDSVSMDWRVFLLAAGLALSTGLIFGMAPAWQASQSKPIDALRSAGRSTSGGSQIRWRTALTIAEVALSLILLVGASLLLRSFSTLMGVDLGFQPDHVIAMNIALPPQRYPGPLARLQFFQNLESRVRALPGVQAVAYVNRLPLRGGWSSGIRIDDDPERQADPDFQAVNPAYFQTLGIPLVQGRTLTDQDTNTSQPVAVVNRAFSKLLLEGREAVGHTMQRNPTAPKITVVGVVNDIRRAGKDSDIKPEVYLPAAQIGLYPVQLADFAVRTANDPKNSVNAIMAEVWAIDKDQPVNSVRTMDEIVDRAVSERRFQTLLLVIFASVAVVLAIVGIYGVLTYSVSQRISELGVRVALGASPSAILGLVMRQAGTLIAIGMVLGVAGAFAVTRFLEGLLFQIKTTDWRAYSAAVVILTIIAVFAAMIPARRGARVDPMVALRQD